MKNRKIMYIWIAVVAIIVSVSVGLIIAFGGKEKEVNAPLNNTQEIQKSNEIDQNQLEDQTNEISNEILVNEIENGIVSEKANVEEGNITSSETLTEDPKTAEEKAIEIVKKDWKENNNVEFATEGMDGNGNYIVIVRKSGNTEALAFYNVNVNTKKFTKREVY